MVPLAPRGILPSSNRCEDLLNERFTLQFQSVDGEKQKEKAPRPFTPGKFYGMTKPAPETPCTVKPHPSRVQQTKPAPETPPTIQTPFQHNPLVVRQHELPIMQPKFTAHKGGKPELHVKRGRFILSISKTMTLWETADELVTRYIRGYKDKSTGEINFLLPTACSKIVARVACEIMGEKVAMMGCHEQSFDKDNFMANMIEEAKLARCCGRNACPHSKKLLMYSFIFLKKLSSIRACIF